MEETLSIERVRDFSQKHPYQKGNNGSNVCGFWLSIDQLLELTSDLIKQGSSGIAFAVGCHDYTENSNIVYDENCKEKPLQWYSVEAIPLSGEIQKYKGRELGPDVIISESEVTDNVKNPSKPKIKGYINGNISNLILHIQEHLQQGCEAQRFPPPAP